MQKPKITATLLELERIPVTSTNIVSIGHDGAVHLIVEFKNHVIWSYTPVTPIGYNLFLQAESKGKWFNENIRLNASITANRLI